MIRATKASFATLAIAILCIIELYNLAGCTDYIWVGVMP